MWSLTMLNSQAGNLSIGGTIAKRVEESKIRFQVRLDNIGNSMATPDLIDAEVQSKLSSSFPPTIEEQFRWIDLRGAEGWWTTLMGGVWINGEKMLKSQPVLLDIQSPFILAPPQAVQQFYKNIAWSKRMPKPHDNFFKFPCLNPPNIAFEFAGWFFPTLSGDLTKEEYFSGPAGGRLSLGKAGNGTGYCIGAVVETRLGVSGSSDPEGQDTWEGSGLKDMWIIGEPFFRGTGVVFDTNARRVGFRTYGDYAYGV